MTSPPGSGSGAGPGAGSTAGGSKPRVGADSAARVPLSHDSHSSSGAGSMSAAGTRYVPRT